MDQTPSPKSDLRCSFCGKAHDDVWKLIAGREAAICDECVAVCAGIVAKFPRPAPPEPRQTEV